MVSILLFYDLIAGGLVGSTLESMPDKDSIA